MRKQKFVSARSVAQDLIIKSCADALTAKVNELMGDPKKLWNTTKQQLHSKPTSTICNDECVVMSSAFCQFFTDKVAQVYQAITEVVQSFNGSSSLMFRPFVSSPLNAFMNVSLTVVFKLISSMPTK